MKYYHLYYIYWANGESGATGSYDIAQSTNKADIDKIIADNNLNVIPAEKLERGQSNVFVLLEFEPNFPEYFNQDKLEAALEEERQIKEELEFTRKAAEDLLEELNNIDWGKR